MNQELTLSPEHFMPEGMEGFAKTIYPAGVRENMRMAGYINTWDMTGNEIINRAIANVNNPQLDLEIRDGYLTTRTPIDKLQKTDITTATAAAYNALFGAIAIIQISQQQTAYGAMPKRGYPREGFRAISAGAIASGAGVAQGAAVGTAVVPTYQEITVGLKELEVVTGMTSRMEVVSTKNDTIEFGGNAQNVFSNFMEAIDVDLLQDFDTLAGDNLESIDRVTASAAEQAALGYTAGDDDLYGVDRGANAWWDSNADHASGVDRAMSKSIVDALMAAQIDRWGGNKDQKLYLGKTDTWTEWSAIEGARQRFGEDTFATTINGIETWTGNVGGYKLTTYDGIPFLWDQNVQADTIGRLYLLDLNHLGIVLGREMDFIESDNPYEVGHNHRGLWYAIQELWADLPSGCGKLRDLKTA